VRKLGKDIGANVYRYYVDYDNNNNNNNIPEVVVWL
jgi:hypothetical protein